MHGLCAMHALGSALGPIQSPASVSVCADAASQASLCECAWASTQGATMHAHTSAIHPCMHPASSLHASGPLASNSNTSHAHTHACSFTLVRRRVAVLPVQACHERRGGQEDAPILSLRVSHMRELLGAVKMHEGTATGTGRLGSGRDLRPADS